MAVCREVLVEKFEELVPAAGVEPATFRAGGDVTMIRRNSPARTSIKNNVFH